MKTLILSALLALSSVAHAVAQNNDLSSDLTILQDQHFSRTVRDLSITLNLFQNQLVLKGMNVPCPVQPSGIRCLAMPSPFEIRLPIVKTATSCGSTIYKAHTDHRPVDGMLKELTLVDHTTRLCDDFRFGVEVVYLTQYYDRLNGKEVIETSVLRGEEFRPALTLVAAPEFVQNEHFLGAPVINTALTVNLKRNTITLTVYQSACPQATPGGAVCLGLIQQEVELPIERVDTSCGSTVYIASRDQRPVDGLYEKISVMDNSTRTCKDLRPARVEISYLTKSLLGGSAQSILHAPALEVVKE